MRNTVTRLGLAAALAMGSAGTVAALAPSAARATGPSGCTAQTNNGFVAAGTLTDTAPPAAPTQPPPASASCTFTLPTTAQGGGGWVGGDSVSWAITGTLAAKDATGQPCVASGKGAANGGYGCLVAGSTYTLTIG